MPHFKLTLAYDGTELVGWQRQAAGVSVQGLLEEALAELDERPVTVTGAGRTDAGVHARGQVASVSLVRSIDAGTLVRAVNARLPATVRALEAVDAPPEFHARFSARSKSYRYRIWNADVLSPFERAYAWHVPGHLDIDRMAEAASLLVGTHDFAAFQAAGTETRTTVRTIFSSRLEQHPALVVYDVCGNGFLRHMVRTIVGTLVEAGRGKHSADTAAWIGEVLASRDRGQAGQTAPAQGLFLMAVSYDFVG